MKTYRFPERKRKYFKRFCKITNTESFLPERVVNNDEIIDNNKLTCKSNIIIKTIGVENRRVAPDEYSDSDMLVIPVRKCLKELDMKPGDLSRLIVNKYIGDNLLPMTASILQRKLENDTAVHAFDIDGGMSSFLHSIDAASRFISTGDKNVLIASGGINYRMISKSDIRVAFLFGDAATSVLLAHSDKQHILASYFYTNSLYYDLAISHSPLSVVEEVKKDQNTDISKYFYDTYKMDNWKKAENFFIEATKTISKNLLEESGLSMKKIDLVLVTENNIRIRELTLDVLKINKKKSISLIRDYGNTMSAMLPLQLDHGFKSGKIQSGMNIMMISHGEGISGGGMIYKV